MERKTNKLSFPQLEDQLKRTRMFATSAAEDAIDGSRAVYQSELYKDSCIEDAIEYEILTNPSDYTKLGHIPNNGVTLVRAVFPPQEISEHYHDHCESFVVENGLVNFEIRGVDVKLDEGGSIRIPANSFHKTVFFEKTVAIVGLPTDYAMKNL